MNEDIDVVEDNFHAFRISNKVRRQISAVDLHAADLGSLAGDAWNEAAIADNTGVFHMSQNTLAYCSELCSEPLTSFVRGPAASVLQALHIDNPVDGELRKGWHEKSPLLSI